MHGDPAGAPRRLDDGAGSQRDPQAHADAAEDPLERAELDASDGRDPPPGQDPLEPLAVRAAGAEDQDLDPCEPGPGLGRPVPCRWRDQGELLLDDRLLDQRGATPGSSRPGPGKPRRLPAADLIRGLVPEAEDVAGTLAATR